MGRSCCWVGVHVTHPTGVSLALFTGLTAGAAVLPDIDHPNSTLVSGAPPMWSGTWLTTEGCPLSYPFKQHRRLLPRPLAFATGTRPETDRHSACPSTRQSPELLPGYWRSQ